MDISFECLDCNSQLRVIDKSFPFSINRKQEVHEINLFGFTCNCPKDKENPQWLLIIGKMMLALWDK